MSKVCSFSRFVNEVVNEGEILVDYALWRLKECKDNNCSYTTICPNKRL